MRGINRFGGSLGSGLGGIGRLARGLVKQLDRSDKTGVVRAFEKRGYFNLIKHNKPEGHSK